MHTGRRDRRRMGTPGGRGVVFSGRIAEIGVRACTYVCDLRREVYSSGGVDHEPSIEENIIIIRTRTQCIHDNCKTYIVEDRVEQDLRVRLLHRT